MARRLRAARCLACALRNSPICHCEEGVSNTFSVAARQSNLGAERQLAIVKLTEAVPRMKREYQAFVYIMTNKRHSVLYTGVTNNLARRLIEHKTKMAKGFTSRYNADKLVYYEMTEWIQDAIEREKQIKGGSRQKKIELINSINLHWNDLADKVLTN